MEYDISNTFWKVLLFNQGFRLLRLEMYNFPNDFIIRFIFHSFLKTTVSFLKFQNSFF